MYLHGLWRLSPQFGTVLERVRPCDLAGGSAPLGIGFESVKIYAISHLLFLPPACGSRCGPSASASAAIPAGCHGSVSLL